MSVVVVGGGLAGLAAARELSRAGCDALVLEAGDLVSAPITDLSLLHVHPGRG